MNKITNNFSSSSIFLTAFFSTWAVLLLYRFVPAEYLEYGAVKIVYSCVMLLSAVTAVTMFFINFRSMKFRAWLSIIWFYACIEALLKSYV
ncbi:MAG: hypothetical protein K2L31_09195 [Muribaculum sp.]|nr:hypothetical protein [Muribaculum sp.]